MNENIIWSEIKNEIEMKKKLSPQVSYLVMIINGESEFTN